MTAHSFILFQTKAAIEINNSKISNTVFNLALPIAEARGCGVYEVEYVKEGGNYVLRVVLDTVDDNSASVSIDMCEEVSRALGDELDRVNPIDGPYILEVSSPGLDRPLKRDEDFVRFAGRKVEIGLYRAVNGRKTFVGMLKGTAGSEVIIDLNGEELAFDRKDAAYVRLAVEF